MIGDVLTTSILFEAIKNKYPHSELHYVINSHTFPVVENNPFIDKFVFVTPEIEKSKLQFLAFLKQAKKKKYDVVIDVYSKLSSNLVTLFSGAKTKISKHKWYTSFLYTQTCKYEKTAKTNAGLAIENRLQLLESLDISGGKLLKPKIYLTEGEKKTARTSLVANQIDLDTPLYMISVLGSGKNKTYPFDFMATVLNMIIKEKPQTQILFNYIPNQKDDAKSIFELCKDETQKQIFFNVSGKNLREFLAITHYCDALIGNEGGATNMAKALNISTFSIFSPWIDKATWSVFEEDNKNVAVHLKDFKPEFYLNAPEKKMKSKALELYDAFLPDLFYDKLILFLNQTHG